MEQIRIATTTSLTSRLGFGCAHLVGAVSWRKSLYLLQCAYDNGIRHYDVAPMYGFAEAERCLGSFLKGRAHATVTTKFGIVPQPTTMSQRIARAIAKPISRVQRQFFGRTIDSSHELPLLTCYDAKQAARSLDQSLANLNVDHIQVFLLHEVTANDLDDDELLRFLEDAVTSGKIGTFGVGSDVEKIAALLHKRPEFCRLVQHQFPWTSQIPELQSPPRIFHGLFGDCIWSAFDELRSNTDLCSHWSSSLGCDLTNACDFGRAVIRTAAVVHPETVLLTSSTKPEHIVHNCEALKWTESDDHLKSFAEWIRCREMVAR